MKDTIIEDKIYKIVIFIFLTVVLVMCLIFTSSLLGDIVPTDFTDPLKNNYYIKGTKDGTKLYNKSHDYKYPDNFPKENIIEKIEKEDILLLRCEPNIFYIINVTSDEIVGPLSEKELLEESVKYLDIDFLDWENIIR